MAKSSENKISIGGSATGNVLITGDHAQVHYRDSGPASSVIPNPVLGEDGQRPTRASLRKLLSAIFIAESDFTAFCSDYFPKIQQRFAGAMDRTDKITILLDQAGPDSVLLNLREAFPEKLARHGDLLRYEPSS
jgi:hypothetical protein